MMRKPATRTNPARARVATTRSQQAPILGWNTRDSIANMDRGYAVILDNWFPLTSDIRMRPGDAEHVTGIDGEVETLVVYKPASGDNELFAFADDSLYDVTAAGAVGAAVATGLTNARWQYENFSTSGGNFVIAVNGADDMILYDGSTVGTIDSGSTPSITNVATADLINITIFKERPFYVERDTLSCWYPAVGAFAGALTKFPLTSVAKDGGYLVAQASWSRDTGTGPDDFFVSITSEGEVIVYNGINPATDFALIGVYKTGKPIGRRCFRKFGGDLLVITTDGVIPMSRLVVQDRGDAMVAVTDIIQGSMADAVRDYSAEFGWEIVLHPVQNALIMNVPAISQSQQFVMNSYTKAWCRFLRWDANCFAEMGGRLYYGTTDEVREAWTGTSDVDGNVVAEAVLSFDYFRDRGNIKETNLVRPVMRWDVVPASLKIGVDADFNVRTPTSDISRPQQVGALWDSALWDAAFWTGDPTVQSYWQTATAIGYALAFHIIAENSSSTWISMQSVDITYERGSTL